MQGPTKTGTLAGAAQDDGQVRGGIDAPKAEALIAFWERRYVEAARAWVVLRPGLRRIGGGNAQRELFEQVLVEARIFRAAELGPAQRADRYRGANRFRDSASCPLPRGLLYRRRKAPLIRAPTFFEFALNSHADPPWDR
jgi:hypothetical protein